MTSTEINNIFEFVKTQMSVYDTESDTAIMNSVLGAISILNMNGISNTQILTFAGMIAVKFIVDGTWQVSGSNIIKNSDIEWYLSRLHGETLIENEQGVL